MITKAQLQRENEILLGALKLANEALQEICGVVVKIERKRTEWATEQEQLERFRAETVEYKRR